MDFNTSVASPSPVALDIKPPQSQSPLEIAGQMQEIQGRKLQMQTLGMENQQRQMDLQDQLKMRSLLPQLLSDPSFKGEDGTPDWNKVTQALAPHVSPKTAFALQQTILGNQEKVANIAKARAATNLDQSKVEEAERDYLGNVGLQIQKGGYNPGVVDTWLSHAETLHPSYKAHVDQLRALIAQNPENLKTIVDGLVAGSGAATKEQREQGSADITNEKNKQETAASKRTLAIQELTGITDSQGNVTDPEAFGRWQRKYGEIAPSVKTPQAISQFLRSGVPVKDQPEFDIGSYKAKMGLIGNSEYDQFLARFAQSKGKTPATLTAAEGLDSFQKFAELKQDPVMRSLAISQKQLAETMARAQLAQMPSDQDYKVLAESLYDKTLSPTQFNELKAGRMGQVSPSKVFLVAKQLHPDFSMAKAEAEFKAYEATEKAFTEGKEAGLVRTNNNAIEHAALLNEARIALKGGNVPALQRIANAFGTATGGNAATIFDHIAERVGDEVTKAFIPGGGSAGERQAAGHGSYSSKMGDAQNEGNIRADIMLLDSQQRHLIDQYKRGTYNQGGQQLFTPEAMAARDRLLGGGGGGGSAAAPAGKIAVISPEGTPGLIDADKWDAAQKRGFKRQ